jgi:hypothetical protein
MGFPHGHRKTTTLVAGLRMTGMVAPMVHDGPINGDWFEAYVTKVLVPELRPGDIVMTCSPDCYQSGVESRSLCTATQTSSPSQGCLQRKTLAANGPVLRWQSTGTPKAVRRRSSIS